MFAGMFVLGVTGQKMVQVALAVILGVLVEWQ